MRIATYGRPGVVYIDLPEDIINAKLSEMPIIPPRCPSPPLSLAPLPLIKNCYKEVSLSSNPLVIIGKFKTPTNTYFKYSCI